MGIRLLHVFVAIGIAIFANSIEPDWLGFLALIFMLGAYSYLVLFPLIKGKKRD